eukprot:gene14464-19414_t
MSQVTLNYNGGVPKCVIKLHKNETRISWHPKYADLNSLISRKFPSKEAKAMIAVEDLGRGSTGKTWLLCTLSIHPAICVMKLYNKSNSRIIALNAEKQWWDAAYPEFSSMTKVEVWSGSDALVMPHFTSILIQDREMFKVSIKKFLEEKFHEKRIVHHDL